MQKLAFFLPSLRGGGAERVIMTLANMFAEHDYQVDLVVAQAEGPYLSKVSAKVRLVNLDCHRTILCLLPLRRYLRLEKPDIILATMEYANILVSITSILAGYQGKVFLREANTSSVILANMSPLKATLFKLLMKFSYRRATAVIAPSTMVARDTERLLGLVDESVKVVYNPIVTTELLTKMAEPLHDIWFTDKHYPVVLAVGRLTRQKDFASLITAFAIVRQTRTCRLLILGEGEERHLLEQQIAHLGLTKDIVLPGFTENPFNYMKNADVFVLSSLWEGLPGTLIQAMACGCPVVTTDCPGGSAEIVQAGRYGKLVPVSNPQRLATAIIEVLDGDIVADAKQHAASFTPEASYHGYQHVFGLASK